MVIIDKIIRAVRTADGLRRRDAEFLLHGADEDFEAIENQRLGGGNDRRYLGTNQRAENEGQRTVVRALTIDLRDRGVRFINRVDERQRHLVESDSLELREQ